MPFSSYSLFSVVTISYSAHFRNDSLVWDFYNNLKVKWSVCLSTCLLLPTLNCRRAAGARLEMPGWFGASQGFALQSYWGPPGPSLSPGFPGAVVGVRVGLKLRGGRENMNSRGMVS